MNFIDYSQYSSFHKCDAYWKEKYLHGVTHNFGESERADAMAIGSFVHAAREHETRHGTLPVGWETLVLGLQLTQEAMRTAKQLAIGYTRQFGADPFRLFATENILTAPLPLAGWEMLAKLDGALAVERLMVVDAGVAGQITLQPGVYSKEYKTRKAGTKRANWMARWPSNMQVDFQMLTLEHAIAQDIGGLGRFQGQGVRGVLVSALEMPDGKEPQRTCSVKKGGCGLALSYYSWVPTDTKNVYSCPRCGNKQELSTPKEKDEQPIYYRVVATRTPEQLARARNEIAATARRMDAIMQGGALLPDRERCNDVVWGLCTYHELHVGEPPSEAAPPMFKIVNPREYLEVEKWQ